MSFTLERIGKSFAEVIKPYFYRHVEKKLDNFTLHIKGQENLDALSPKSYLFVSNHVKPEDETDALKRSGLSPDSFIFRKVLAGAGINVRFVSQFDTGDRAWVEKHIPGAKRAIRNFHKGINKGFNAIPVSKRMGALNKDFVRETQKAVTQRDSVLIYPFEDWSDLPVEEQQIQPGAAFLARMLGLSIVPLYITGCTSWRRPQNVTIVIGTPIDTPLATRDQLNEQIKKSIVQLEEQVL